MLACYELNDSLFLLTISLLSKTSDTKLDTVALQDTTDRLELLN